MLDVQKVLMILGKSYEDFGLPDPADEAPQGINNAVNISQEADLADQLTPTLNEL